MSSRSASAASIAAPPLRLADHRADHHAGAAVVAVRLDDQALALAGHVLEEIASAAVEQRGAAVAQEPRPRDVGGEHAALERREVARRQGRIAEHLEAGLLVQLGRDRRDHPVLREQGAHRADVDALRLHLEQIDHRVVAVGHVDDVALVGDLVAAELELGRVGVMDGHPEVLAEVAGHLGQLVRPARVVLRLHEAERGAAPPDRLQVIDQVLDQQAPDIGGQLELQLRVGAAEERQHQVVQDLVGGRDHVQAADAAQVRLQEPEARLPLRGAEVDDRVVAAEHEIGVAHVRLPVGAQPGLLRLRQREHLAHLRIGEVEVRQAGERVVERQGHRAHVGQLVGQRRDRHRQDADHVHLVAAQVDQVALAGRLADGVHEPAHLGVAEAVERAPHPRGQALAGQPGFLDRGQQAMTLRSFHGTRFR